MKPLLFSICIILLFASGVCRRTCDNYIITSINGPIEDYFGVYKSGNWWVYQNKDGSKRDSIYVIDYSDQHLQDRTSCLEYEERKFDLKSRFLMNGTDIPVDYISQNKSTSMHFALVEFVYYEDTKTLVAISDPFNQGQNSFDSVSINNMTYHNILRGTYSYNTYVYYFAKGKGLVGWTANGDTFNLINYKIL